MVLQWDVNADAGYPSTGGRGKGGDREPTADREIFEKNGKHSVTSAIRRSSGVGMNEDAAASSPQERFWENLQMMQLAARLRLG
jgi:hypothetical protein